MFVGWFLTSSEFDPPNHLSKPPTEDNLNAFPWVGNKKAF